MTDQQAADDLNTAYVQYTVPVSSRELLAWAGENNRFKKIDDARTSNSVSTAVQNVSEIAVRLVERDDAAYDQSDARHANLLNALVSESVISQSDADALNNLGKRNQTRAEELNLLGRSAKIAAPHVSEARK